MKQLLIARSVIKLKSNRIPVKMINSCVSPVKLKKGMILGNHQAVGSVMTTGEIQDIAQHEEGISICSLKNSKLQHKKVELEDICSHQKGKASEPDENNLMHSSEVQNRRMLRLTRLQRSIRQMICKVG